MPESLSYAYVVSNKIISREDLKRNKFPLLPNKYNECYREHYWNNAHVLALAEATEKVFGDDQLSLVYKCVYLGNDNNNKTIGKEYFDGKDLSIIEVQPISLSDKSKVLYKGRDLEYDKKIQEIIQDEKKPNPPLFVKLPNKGTPYIQGQLENQSILFVPAPKFRPPHCIDELIKNLELYKLYRFGPERGMIEYLRKFGMFKGYSAAEKKIVVTKLLEACREQQIKPTLTLTKRELKILHNGLLSKASRGFENLVTIKPENPTSKNMQM